MLSATSCGVWRELVGKAKRPGSGVQGSRYALASARRETWEEAALPRRAVQHLPAHRAFLTFLALASLSRGPFVCNFIRDIKLFHVSPLSHYLMLALPSFR